MPLIVSLERLAAVTAPAARFWTARMGETMDDVFLLSRIQFALTIMFHYIFPPLSIGLGAIMVIMEGTYLRTGNVIYHQMTRFWSRIFAVNFAMGVATGLVMEFQFGTNWAAYSRYVGDVFGSALAAEGIFAFFLFLAAYLVLSAWTLIALPDSMANFARHPWLWVVPILNVLAIANIPRAIYQGRPFDAFLSSGAAIAAFTFLFGAALFPNLIVSSEGAADSLTVSRAASSEKTQEIMLVVAAL